MIHCVTVADNHTVLAGRNGKFNWCGQSFYGLLGFSLAVFNDFGEADRVTRIGQKLLRRMIGAIQEKGGRVVEADTDGVLFVPPEDARGEDAEIAAHLSLVPVNEAGQLPDRFDVLRPDGLDEFPALRGEHLFGALEAEDLNAVHPTAGERPRHVSAAVSTLVGVAAGGRPVYFCHVYFPLPLSFDLNIITLSEMLKF
jgi:hypothetical protein